MTIPAVSRRNIAIRLAATVWMSSARTTRGLAISSKTPARERIVKPIVRPALPRGGRMTLIADYPFASVEGFGALLRLQRRDLFGRAVENVRHRPAQEPGVGVDL